MNIIRAVILIALHLCMSSTHAQVNLPYPYDPLPPVTPAPTALIQQARPVPGVYCEKVSLPGKYTEYRLKASSKGKLRKVVLTDCLLSLPENPSIFSQQSVPIFPLTAPLQWNAPSLTCFVVLPIDGLPEFSIRFDDPTEISDDKIDDCFNRAMPITPNKVSDITSV